MHESAKSGNFSVRRATVADASVIALHRASMFLDMGTITSDVSPPLQALTVQYLQRAMPAGEYLGWLAFENSALESIIGGAGLLMRQIPPFPMVHGPLAGTVASGKQALVMNVYVHPEWRRHGVAKRVMQEVMAFSDGDGVESLVLHASNAGRPLYEQLGFIPTNEMRFVPPAPT